MAVMTEQDAIDVGHQVTRMWWLFLVTGIAWVIVSFMVLGFDPTTPATIGYLAGFVLIAVGVNEFVELGFAEGWKWVHGVLGAIFVVTGIMALMSPFQTFGILALLVGWYLLVKGIVTLILSILARHVLPLWGLGLAAGIVEMVVGVWAIGYPGRSAWLLVLWVGLGALMHGITQIVLAFQLRGARPRSPSPPTTRTTIKDTPMTKPRIIIAALAAAVLLISGCSQKYAAERDGKKLGEAICDLRDAENADRSRRSARRYQRAARRPRRQVRLLHRGGPGRHPEQPGRFLRTRHPGTT